MTPRIVFLAWLLLPIMAHSADVERKPNRSAYFHAAVGKYQPLTELPGHVPAPEGNVTLWADFESNDPEGVPLFLVNRTNRDLSYGSRDFDIGVVLEYWDEDSGSWKRGQAGPSQPGCGNGFFSLPLPARHFFAFHGYRATEGFRAKVRYAKKSGAPPRSNEGPGLISPDDLEAVANDLLTLDYPHQISLSELRSTPEDFSPAMLAKRAHAVRLLTWYPGTEYVIQAVRSLQQSATNAPASTERDEVLQSIETYLARIHESKPDGVQRNRICLSCLSGDLNAVKAMPEEVAWALLQVPHPAPGDQGEFTDPELWRPLVAPAIAHMKAIPRVIGDHSEMEILSANWILDSIVPTAELETWVTSGPTHLRELGIAAMIRRSCNVRLIERVRKLDSPDQLHALKFILGQPKGLQEALVLGERLALFDFVSHCAKTSPLETAYLVQEAGNDTLAAVYGGRGVSDALREFFRNEAETGRKEWQLDFGKASQLKAGLSMLMARQDPSDNAMLQQLTGHGGYLEPTRITNGDVKVEVATRRYVLRPMAQAELILRGVPLEIPRTLADPPPAGL